MVDQGEIEFRIFREVDDIRAYRAALFMVFAGRDVRRVEESIREREDICKLIAIAMDRAGASQVAVARRAGVDQAVVSRAVNGRKVAHRAKLAIYDAARAMADEKTS